jgi:enoyl-CoA hydratase/carnithine racemase
MKRAKYMLLTSATIDATEAERIGLINQVAPHEELDRATDQLVGQVLKSGPRALREFKRMLNDHIGEFEMDRVIQALSSEESQEGMAAFTEKRRPNWRE